MFQLTEDQLNLQELVRDFSENDLRPRAQELDKSGEYPFRRKIRSQEIK